MVEQKRSFFETADRKSKSEPLRSKRKYQRNKQPTLSETSERKADRVRARESGEDRVKMRVREREKERERRGKGERDRGSERERQTE